MMAEWNIYNDSNFFRGFRGKRKVGRTGERHGMQINFRTSSFADLILRLGEIDPWRKILRILFSKINCFLFSRFNECLGNCYICISL